LDTLLAMEGVPEAVIVDLDNDQFLLRQGIDNPENDAEMIPSHIRRELEHAFRQLSKRKIFSRRKETTITADGTTLPTEVKTNKVYVSLDTLS
jgi:hypothetical protein